MYKKILEEFNYQIHLIRIKISAWNKQEEYGYCQSQIEDGLWCDRQCEHCKEYFKPLEEQRNHKT